MRQFLRSVCSLHVACLCISVQVSASTRTRSAKVVRHFFGGGQTSAPSFDPAKELGVQEPVGFWDPLGLSADNDEATFKRRRAVEIKHGRIAARLCCSLFFVVLRRFVDSCLLRGGTKHQARKIQNRSAALQCIQ